MLDFQLIDETFDKNNTTNYGLSIQVFLNGFSFCIFDTIRQKFILLEKNTFDDFALLLNSFDENIFFKYKYKVVKIIIESERSTLLPEGLFSKENINKIYNYNFEDSENLKIYYNKLKTANSYIIYSANKEVINKLNSVFTNYIIYNQATPFIENTLIENKNKLFDPKIFINSSLNFYDILIVEKNEITLHNTYTYKSIDDFVFYAMNIFEQHNLNPENIKLEIMGLIDEKSDLLKLLKKYIKKISIAKRSKDFTYSYTFNQINQHEYFNLFNTVKCE